ncbi:MAG TPA: SDR family NAD(P)-dependent oxidoreductase [Acidobacteriota bacterium]|nr:SDR family NAD(P)-dependent oxidoreductase [Acidobacteriota bacterium]
MSERPLVGRRAVVTGASRGIGAAVARALAEAGAAVVLAARTAEPLEALAAGLRGEGAEATAVPCDVTDEAAVRRLGERARGHGPVDILVNNAGDGASAPLARITLAEWNRTMAVNATATFLCTREFVPAMVERRHGRVVNIASVAALEGAKYVAHYAAAKHAVLGFTRSVSAETEGSGVTVNALCPAYVDTAMTARTVENVMSRTGLGAAEALAAVLATVGQSRLVSPSEVAAEVVRLCTDDAASVTGAAIVLDGGARTA